MTDCFRRLLESQKKSQGFLSGEISRATERGRRLSVSPNRLPRSIFRTPGGPWPSSGIPRSFLRDDRGQTARNRLPLRGDVGAVGREVGGGTRVVFLRGGAGFLMMLRGVRGAVREQPVAMGQGIMRLDGAIHGTSLDSVGHPVYKVLTLKTLWRFSESSPYSKAPILTLLKEAVPIVPWRALFLPQKRAKS